MIIRWQCCETCTTSLKRASQTCVRHEKRSMGMRMLNVTCYPGCKRKCKPPGVAIGGASINKNSICVYKMSFHLKSFAVYFKKSGNHIYLQAFVIFQDNFKQVKQLLTMNKYINETMIRLIDACIFVRRELYWSCVDLDLCVCVRWSMLGSLRIERNIVGMKWDMYQQG